VTQVSNPATTRAFELTAEEDETLANRLLTLAVTGLSSR
jgi:hypothetical protein